LFTAPVIQTIKPFDATVGATITFTVQSGPQVVKNKLIIKDNSTSLTIYEKEQVTFLLQHIIPPSVELLEAERMINGNAYQAIIYVADISNNWSVASESTIFWVFSPPTLLITNIDAFDHIYNQTETFSTTYSHTESELLSSFRYFLYDENQNLITAFSEQYSDGSTPLTQEITGLLNGITYFVEVQTLSQNAQEATSGLIEFVPLYIAPRLLTTLELENAPNKGAIKLSANILQIVLKLYDNSDLEILPDDIVYTDNTWLDLNDVNYSKAVGLEGFSILQSNFMFQMWVKNLVENEDIFKLISPQGTLYGQYYGNRIHIFKTLTGTNYITHFASEEFTLINPTDTIVFRFDHIDNLIDVTVSV